MVQQFAMIVKLISQILEEELFDNIIAILIGAEYERLKQLSRVCVLITETAREDF